MTSTITLARFTLFCAQLLSAIAACGSSAPHAPRHPQTKQQANHQANSQGNPDEIAITGEFLPDGSCRVMANNVPVYGGDEHPVTTYVRGRAMNMAPSGYDVHELWCSLTNEKEPAIPSEPDLRAFFINVYVPTGRLAAAQRYVVKAGMPLRDARDVAMRATVSLFDPRYASTGEDTLPVLGVYLAGVRGEVIFTGVKPDRVTGTFHVMAVRERSMM